LPAKGKMAAATIYSVIVPIYNEQDCIKTLYNDLYREMKSISDPFEIIFVDDGSDDNSRQVLKEISSIANNLIVVYLDGHFGKSIALQTGLAHSQGSTVITIDADLQFDAGDIHLLLNKKNEGFDVVCGWRYKRSDSWKKIGAAIIGNFLRRLIFHERIHDVGCSLRVYTREAFASIRLYRERHRFITAILTKKGFSLSEVKVRHYPRRFGISKYGIMERLFKSIPDFFSILIGG
jgi:glycosyltransferase involved in cell wall biosynthesis